MFNLKINPMKALKITLLVALFVAVSSQAVKTSKTDSENPYKTTTHNDLLAHERGKVSVPDHS